MSYKHSATVEAKKPLPKDDYGINTHIHTGDSKHHHTGDNTHPLGETKHTTDKHHKEDKDHHHKLDDKDHHHTKDHHHKGDAKDHHKVDKHHIGDTKHQTNPGDTDRIHGEALFPNAPNTMHPNVGEHLHKEVHLPPGEINHRGVQTYPPGTTNLATHLDRPEKPVAYTGQPVPTVYPGQPGVVNPTHPNVHPGQPVHPVAANPTLPTTVAQPVHPGVVNPTHPNVHPGQPVYTDKPVYPGQPVFTGQPIANNPTHHEDPNHHSIGHDLTHPKDAVHDIGKGMKHALGKKHKERKNFKQPGFKAGHTHYPDK
jgi:hypothetical protein